MSAAKYGFLYQGQWYSWQKQRRGTPALDLPPRRVRQLSRRTTIRSRTRACGQRLPSADVAPARYRALTALLLLGPATPMLFQGQEFAASAPFLYFADHKRGACATPCASGAGEFLRSFPALAIPRSRTSLADPARRGDVRALQARSGRARDATPRRTRCIATCSRCAATTRRLGRSGAARRRRGARRRDAFVLRLLRRGRRRSAAGGEPRRAISQLELLVAGAAARAAGGRDVARRRGRSEAPRYGGSGRRRRLAMPTAASWHLPRTSRRCSLRAERADAEEPMSDDDERWT